MPKLSTIAVSLLVATIPTLASAQLMTLKEFEVPDPTAWTPEGCRDVGAEPDAVPSRIAWRNLHADSRSSDEVSRASAPVFTADWLAEPQTYNPTGPVFDGAGNVYFAPLAPIEPNILISLDPTDGSRRWAIPNTTGAPPGFHTPLVLADPTDPTAEAIFLVLSDRAVAVRPDGSAIWDVPVAFPTSSGVIGIQYHGPTDSLIAVSTDGYLLGISRTTGAQTVPVYELPGTVTPAPPSTLPPAAVPCLVQKVSALTDLASVGLNFVDFINLLLGNNIEVANSFSIDQNTGRIWVAATAPDETDGTLDGVSEFGALYGIDLEQSGAGVEAATACRVDFPGGTAATPALNATGTRIYAADNEGAVLAYDADDCSQVWSLDVGAQVFGSIGVSSDNNELYASSRSAVRQLFDRGDHAELGWTSTSDVFDIPAPLQGVISHFNLLLAGVSATAVNVQVGVGIVTPNRDLPFQQASVLLDRDTGEPRWASEALDESVAVNSVGPDGATYLGNSPVRRVIARCLLELGAAGIIPPVIPLPPGLTVDDVTPAIVGGIRKYGPQRLDLLARDATCAASDRAGNAHDNRFMCFDSADADVDQVLELIAQAKAAGAQANADGDLSRRTWRRARGSIRFAEFVLRIFGVHGLGFAEVLLDSGCERLMR